MKKISLTLIVVSILGLGGCASTPLDYKSGTEVSQLQLDSFVAGKTTQQGVIDTIGQPNRKNELKSKELWYYDFNKVGVFSGNVSEATVFEWDSKGALLKSYKTGKSGKTGNPLIDAANN